MIKTFALAWALYIFWIFAQIYCAMNPALAQNGMGSHPDKRADRDHSSTLSRDAHEAKLRLCMTDLRTIIDPSLRHWCEAQSRKLP